MSLAELKEAVVALSPAERNQLRDVLDAMEEGVTVEQLHQIDHMLDETLTDTRPSMPIEQVRLEMNELIASLAKKNGS